MSTRGGDRSAILAQRLRELDADGIQALFEGGLITVDAIEGIDDPAALLLLADALAARVKERLTFWQPLLVGFREGTTKAPRKDLQEAVALVRAAGLALSCHLAEPRCAAGLTRMRKATRVLDSYLPQTKAGKSLFQSGYAVPVVAATPGRAAPTSAEKKRKVARPFSMRRFLIQVLAATLPMAAGAHGVMIWLEKPMFTEQPIEVYQELVPELVGKQLDEGRSLVLTVGRAWPRKPIGERTDDVMRLMESTAVEGWTRMVVRDERARALVRVSPTGFVDWPQERRKARGPK